MKVLIVGSGHGGCAMAAVLAKRGYEVGILKLGKDMHVANFDELEKRKSIRLSGIEGEGDFALSKVSREPAEVVGWADMILVYYVSNYHPMIAERLCPYLRDGQVVVLNPGYLGSIYFERELESKGYDARPLFAEFETLPYSSRIIEAGSVWISSKNVRHPFAAYPARRSAEVKSILEPVIGECVPRSHLLEVALHNPNLVIHTIGVLMNVSLVEGKEKRFAMYRDGFSKSMWNLVFRLDEEKMRVLEGLGAERITYFDEFRLRTFEDCSIDPIAGFNHYAGEAPDGPFSIDHRYITEDLPMGLGLLSSLGRVMDIETPICDSLINLADAFLPQYGFWSHLRRVESLWAGSVGGFVDVLKYGENKKEAIKGLAGAVNA